ncbi:hypothetical protein HYP93_gp18 [Stenotrophomonas phage Pokken]|uniref:Uncharacterized protein n=1 Tax=Stenotrophomonas phage Pokken TaxID=2596674 RepID=A0A5B9NCN4_9CAUD|nr:hypothetical protein HYP93_gp18 [Stenotrophomonas phage Pokken]QEG09241.1 hypothetical protein CPT_Pokken_018 [Stenotrophomonas phage Pokken]
MKKSVRYAIVDAKSKSVMLDFGPHKDLLDKHVNWHKERYGSEPGGLQARVTTTVQIEPADEPVTETSVGITLLHGSSLVLTTDGNFAVHDRESDLYISVGPATTSTLNAIIDAAERLKVHVK